MPPLMSFETDLKKLGLSDKEASVYLAALGLGPSPVQQIARKAHVARATTYVILESLMHDGLVTKYVEDKKTYFVAEAPEQLGRLLDKRVQAIQEHRGELDQLLPKLRAFMRTSDDRPVVRYYTGLEGLKVLRTEMSMATSAKDTWYNFTPLDHIRTVFGSDIDYMYVKPRLAKGINSQSIFTTASNKLKKEVLAAADQVRVQRKFIAPERYRSASGMTIYSDRVAIGSFGAKLGGIIIESESVAQMMCEFFQVAWKNLD